LDVGDADMVERCVAQVLDEKGRIDALVNNAGWSTIAPVAELALADWRRCLDIDLTGTFLTMRHILPAMIERSGGAIVNISSIAAYETSTEHGAAYSAAKAGVLALTRVAAAENGRHGIRVNAITPGLIYNDFLRKIYPAEFFDGYAENRSLVGRVGRPEDVASLVSFLLSDKAGYITGEVYGISGGVHPHG
ncbi:MAG: SDR family oxidoreductase, partial [Burkholderiales bacterium]|nr:SDR family oxidoreductase [Burkholderiales bacterium]